jgi:hypothetical protein
LGSGAKGYEEFQFLAIDSGELLKFDEIDSSFPQLAFRNESMSFA